jgi:hypothetical protein
MTFLATILGKENGAQSCCAWCKMSKTERRTHGHAFGKPRTVEKILEVLQNVQENNSEEKPEK